MCVAHSAEPKTRRRQRASSAEGRRKQDRIADAGPRSERAGTTVPSRGPAFPAGLQTLGSAITWLSGALAGIGAIFYAFGWLATLSNVRMLGLESGSLHYDHLFYVQRGAIFFLYTVVATWRSLLLAIALVLLILYTFLGLRLLYQRSPRLGIMQPFRSLTGRPGTWQGIAYAGLLLMLALQLQTRLEPQGFVSGILRGAVDEGSAGGSIRELILSGNDLLLRDYFTLLAVQQVWIGAL